MKVRCGIGADLAAQRGEDHSTVRRNGEVSIAFRSSGQRSATIHGVNRWTTDDHLRIIRNEFQRDSVIRGRRILDIDLVKNGVGRQTVCVDQVVFGDRIHQHIGQQVPILGDVQVHRPVACRSAGDRQSDLGVGVDRIGENP